MTDKNYYTPEDRQPSLGAKELLAHLQGASFPATKEDLVARARAHDAPDPVLRTLGRLPGSRYAGIDDLTRAFHDLSQRE